MNYEKFFEVFIEFGAVVYLRPLRGMRIGKVDRLVQPTLLDYTLQQSTTFESEE